MIVTAFLQHISQLNGADLLIVVTPEWPPFQPGNRPSFGCRLGGKNSS
jgi:hypothetical protein